MVIAAFRIPKANDALGKRIVWLARMAQFGSRALGDMRIGLLIKDQILWQKPRVILHTFEGHGWERIVNFVAHQMNPSVTTFGYQHAVLLRGDKSISHKHGGGADPNYFLASGPVTRDLYLNSMQFQKLDALVLGTTRTSPVDIKPLSPRRGNCLFAPEGVFDEVKLMARVGIEAARLCRERTFVLRLHPVLNRNRVEQYLGNTPENFLLSNCSLEDDLSMASFVCYRSSTVVLSGIQAGVRPIYLDVDDKMFFNDPLAIDLPFRKNAKNAKDLVDVMSRSAKKRIEDDQYKEALKYVEGYAAPFDAENLIQNINEILRG
jgi:hypothetical protein